MQARSLPLLYDRISSRKLPLQDKMKSTEDFVDEAATHGPGDFIEGRTGSVSQNKFVITASSWRRLIARLEKEEEVMAKTGTNTIPSIDFKDIRYVGFWLHPGPCAIPPENLDITLAAFWTRPPKPPNSWAHGRSLKEELSGFYLLVLHHS